MVTLEGSNDRFRLLYDVKGRFVLHRISEEEAQVGVVYCESRLVQAVQGGEAPGVWKEDSVHCDA